MVLAILKIMSALMVVKHLRTCIVSHEEMIYTHFIN